MLKEEQVTNGKTQTYLAGTQKNSTRKPTLTHFEWLGILNAKVRYFLIYKAHCYALDFSEFTLILHKCHCI